MKASYKPVSQKEVEVQAPATLEEGCTFDSVQEGVAVHEGGVTKGRTVRVPSSIDSADPDGSRMARDWKYDIFDCCALGPFHSSFLCACFCKPCLWASVMTRMNLTWLANNGTSEQVARTFRNVVTLYIVFEFLYACAYVRYKATVSEDAEKNASDLGSALLHTTYFIYVCFFYYIGTKTRMAIRERYNIAGSCFGDFCCVVCCGCCAVSQAAKQTVDCVVNKIKDEPSHESPKDAFVV